MKPVKKKNKEKINQVFKKEYIPVAIAVLLLIVMLLVLFIVLFYKDDYGLILPDAPSEEKLSMEIYDFESAKYDPNDLTQKEIQNTKVEYRFVSDYHKEGIVLSNTTVDYIDGEFVIYSGPFSETPYISVVDIKGKLKWISKIDKSGYESLKIKKIEKLDGKYYIFAVGTTNNLNDNMVIRIDSKGNQEKKEIIEKGTHNTLSTETKIDNGFAFTTDGDDGLMIYMISKDFKLLKNAYSLGKDKNNIFHTYNPYAKSLTYRDKVISAVIEYNGLQNEKMYLLNYNIDNNSSTITPFNELMKLANPYTNIIRESDNSFILGYEKKVYKFNGKGEVVKSYDYSKLRLKEDDLVSDTGETIENYVSVDRIKTYDDYILVRNITNSEYIYDVFDKDFNIKIRYMLNVDEYETKENVLLDVFYIDGKLYEVHSYGFETPSIMISIIG